MNITRCDGCGHEITKQEVCVNVKARLMHGGSNMTYDDYLCGDFCSKCAEKKFGKPVKQD